MRLTPRSLVIDLLSTLRDGSMPVAALVAAGELFGLKENAVRVALARLRASGRVERDERGRYSLGRAAEPVRRLVASWRNPGRRTRAWNGAWVGVLPGRAARARRPARDRALRLLGLAGLDAGLHVRPDNLRGGVAGVREELGRLGLEGHVFELRQLDADADRRARGLWNGLRLHAGYDRSLEELARSRAQLETASRDEGMVESFVLGGRVVQQLVLDPLLPNEIVPGAGRDALVTAMRDYDRLGRSFWSNFLAEHGVPHLRAPFAGAVAAAGPQAAIRSNPLH